MTCAVFGLGLVLAAPAGAYFPRGQCTDWAYKMRPGLVDEATLRLGSLEWDARFWAVNARRAGFKVGRRPAAGAIAVWPAGYHHAGTVGHVAYVERLLAGGRYLISEMNYNGSPQVHRRIVDAADGARTFIYRPSREPVARGDGTLLSVSEVGDVDGGAAIGLRVTGPLRLLVRAIGADGTGFERTLDVNEDAIVPLTTLVGELGPSQDGLGKPAYTLRFVVVGRSEGEHVLTDVATDPSAQVR